MSVLQVRLKCCERDIPGKREFCCYAHLLDRGPVGESSYLISSSVDGAIKAPKSNIDE